MIQDQNKSCGWGPFLLPFIERSDLYKRYTFDAPFNYDNPQYGIENQTVSNTRIDDFLCPSSPDPTEPYKYTLPSYGITWTAFVADMSPVARVAEELTTYLGKQTTEAQRAGCLKADDRRVMQRLSMERQRQRSWSRLLGKIKCGKTVQLTGTNS